MYNLNNLKYKVNMIAYKLKFIKYIINNTISFNYWCKFSAIRNVWVYTTLDLDSSEETMYSLDFGLTMIGEDLFLLPDGIELKQPENIGLYLKKNKEMLPCKVINNKLVLTSKKLK